MAKTAIDAEDMARLARLAHLEISPEEMPAATRAMNGILAMMNQLQKADVDGEDDVSHAQFFGNTLRLRDDVAAPGFALDALMANAPQTANDCFIVPKVIE